MSTAFVMLRVQVRPEGDTGVVMDLFDSNDQRAVPLSYDALTPAAFSRVEKVMTSHDTETCDRCDRRIGLHFDGSTDPETEANTPFFVTSDGLALCEEDAEGEQA